MKRKTQGLLSIKSLFILLASQIILITSCNDDGDLTPKASFEIIDTPVVNQAVSFTSTSTNAKSFEWNFGDGGSSTQENPEYIYVEGGNYAVTLTAIGGGKEDVATEQIVVIGLPTSSFTVPEGTLYDLVDINFTNTSTGADSYLWSFGDTDASSSIEINPIFTYNEAGSFIVTLDATNAAGTHSTALEISTEILPLPEVSFTVLSSEFSGNESIEFVNMSEGADTYVWSFGDVDQSSSSDENPTFVYGEENSYQITLDATNAAGTSSLTQEVMICSSELAGTYNISTEIPQEFTEDTCPAGHTFTGTIDIIYVGAGIYSFNDWSFGSYLECYQGNVNLSGTFNFQSECSVVTINFGNDSFDDPWVFLSDIDGNDWIIRWNNVGVNPNEQGITTITFPGGVPFTVD